MAEQKKVPRLSRAEREARPFPDNLTPAERRVYEFLLDGERHTKTELYGLLEDDLAQFNTVRKHICTLRKKLPPSRLIVCEVDGYAIFYRLIVPLHALGK